MWRIMPRIFSRRFRVLIHGKNLVAVVGEQAKRVGFFAMRFVDAPNECAAEAVAVKRIKSDPKISSFVNPLKDPTIIEVEQIDEVHFWRKRLLPARGFTFYIGESEEREEVR